MKSLKNKNININLNFYKIKLSIFCLASCKLRKIVLFLFLFIVTCYFSSASKSQLSDVLTFHICKNPTMCTDFRFYFKFHSFSNLYFCWAAILINTLDFNLYFVAWNFISPSNNWLITVLIFVQFGFNWHTWV